MAITEYALMWQKAIKELTDVKISLDPDIDGWFFLKNARLSDEQRDRVIANLEDEHFPQEKIKNLLIRMFPDLHHREAAAPQPAPRTGVPSWNGARGRPQRGNIQEAQEGRP